MFSFHKPKIYRSLKGCCICRAKSSSSRFTDSKRYEMDFAKCFWIEEKRSGEICNACVLLVKRWKKLPVGSTRNWHHVVDARAGPGTKSILKIKSRNKEAAEAQQQLARRPKKKHKHKSKQVPRPNRPPQSPGGLSDDIIGDDIMNSDHSSLSTPEHSDCSDYENTTPHKGYSTKGRRKKNPNPVRFSSFLDMSYWKKTEICCGIIFKGCNGEVLVDTTLLRPCRLCKSPPPPVAAACPANNGVVALAKAAESASAALTPQALEGSSPPGSPMEAESASTISMSAADDSRCSSPRSMMTAQRQQQQQHQQHMSATTVISSSSSPSMSPTTAPSALSSSMSSAVSAVLDLSMPVHKDPSAAAAAHVLSQTLMSRGPISRSPMGAALAATQSHRCIEMEV